MSWPWDELGLPGPADLPDIRRAYAWRLKAVRPEEDPEGFQRLHDAYQEASRCARRETPEERSEREIPLTLVPPTPEAETTPQPDGWDFERLIAEGEAETAHRVRKAKRPWRNVWRSLSPWRRAAAVIGVSILGVLALLAFYAPAREACRNLLGGTAAEKWEVQSLEWLEEDFGEPFIRPLRGWSYRNIRAPESDPNLCFWLLRDGERTEDHPGYRTDYPHVRVMRAMEEFAEEWDLELTLDSAGGGFRGGLGDAPGGYLFDLPLQGAGEAITALGNLIEDIQAQTWYRALEDRYGSKAVFQVFLCHRGLSFYDAITGDGSGGFDAEYARTQYETQAGGAFCRYLLEHGGLAARHMGEDAYVLAEQGAVEIGGERCFHVSGLDKEDRQPRVQYLLASDGGILFCLPEGSLERITGLADLRQGSASQLRLNEDSLVTVWDQVVST